MSWVERELDEARDGRGTASHAVGPQSSPASSASTPADESAPDDSVGDSCITDFITALPWEVVKPYKRI